MLRIEDRGARLCDGLSRRDWLHVDDTCRALDLILHCERQDVVGKVFNLGSGSGFDAAG